LDDKLMSMDVLELQAIRGTKTLKLVFANGN